jgi:hypothetical protein
MPASEQDSVTRQMRCVEVNLGPIPTGPEDLNRLVHRALCLQGIGLSVDLRGNPTVRRALPDRVLQTFRVQGGVSGGSELPPILAQVALG